MIYVLCSALRDCLVTETLNVLVQVLGLKTSQIEDMQNALLLVNTMVDQLKEACATQETRRAHRFCSGLSI